MIMHNVDAKGIQSLVYSWKSAAVDIGGTAGGTNLTTVTGFAALFTPFAGVRRPTKIKVLSTGAAYIKVNGGDVITIGATTPFEATDLIVESISISTGGASQTITVYLQ